MALYVEHPEAEKLARQLATYTGETLNAAVIHALREQLAREQEKRRRTSKALKEEILAIGRQCAALPLMDERSADEILGYNVYGLPEQW